MRNLCCGQRRCRWYVLYIMYMIIEEWQILWVLDESSFSNDQNYFYNSLFIPTHHLPSAGTNCWNVAHYQSHFLLKLLNLSNLPLLTDFFTFFTAAKSCFKKRKKKHKLNTFISIHTSIDENTNYRSGKSSCRSIPCRRC